MGLFRGKLWGRNYPILFSIIFVLILISFVYSSSSTTSEVFDNINRYNNHPLHEINVSKHSNSTTVSSDLEAIRNEIYQEPLLDRSRELSITHRIDHVKINNQSYTTTLAYLSENLWDKYATDNASVVMIGFDDLLDFDTTEKVLNISIGQNTQSHIFEGDEIATSQVLPDKFMSTNIGFRGSQIVLPESNLTSDGSSTWNIKVDYFGKSNIDEHVNTVDEYLRLTNSLKEHIKSTWKDHGFTMERTSYITFPTHQALNIAGIKSSFYISVFSPLILLALIFILTALSHIIKSQEERFKLLQLRGFSRNQLLRNLWFWAAFKPFVFMVGMYVFVVHVIFEYLFSFYLLNHILGLALSWMVLQFSVATWLTIRSARVIANNIRPQHIEQNISTSKIKQYRYTVIMVIASLVSLAMAYQEYLVPDNSLNLDLTLEKYQTYLGFFVFFVIMAVLFIVIEKISRGQHSLDNILSGSTLKSQRRVIFMLVMLLFLGNFVITEATPLTLHGHNTDFQIASFDSNVDSELDQYDIYSSAVYNFTQIDGVANAVPYLTFDIQLTSGDDTYPTRLVLVNQSLFEKTKCDECGPLIGDKIWVRGFLYDRVINHDEADIAAGNNRVTINSDKFSRYNFDQDIFRYDVFTSFQSWSSMELGLPANFTDQGNVLDVTPEVYVNIHKVQQSDLGVITLKGEVASILQIPGENIVIHDYTGHSYFTPDVVKKNITLSMRIFIHVITLGVGLFMVFVGNKNNEIWKLATLRYGYTSGVKMNLVKVNLIIFLSSILPSIFGLLLGVFSYRSTGVSLDYSNKYILSLELDGQYLMSSILGYLVLQVVCQHIASFYFIRSLEDRD